MSFKDDVEVTVVFLEISSPISTVLEALPRSWLSNDRINIVNGIITSMEDFQLTFNHEISRSINAESSVLIGFQQFVYLYISKIVTYLVHSPPFPASSVT